MRHALTPLVLVLLATAPGASAREAEETAEAEERSALIEPAFSFLLARGSADPAAEVVFHWTGAIYADVPAAPGDTAERSFGEPLLRFEGFNIARFVQGEEHATARMLSRELGLYLDPASGEPLDCWHNPFTGGDVAVAHVFNDPVNVTLGDTLPRQVGEQLVWSFELALSYPSPLPVDGYPEYSAGNTYQSTEIFDFFVDADALDGAGRMGAPATLSWTRVGPWLPWMQMGQRPGRLIYHATGHKLPGGFDDLPERLRRVVRDTAPEYARAPSEDVSPNATSWTTFRALLESGEYVPACPAGS